MSTPKQHPHDETRTKGPLRARCRYASYVHETLMLVCVEAGMLRQTHD